MLGKGVDVLKNKALKSLRTLTGSLIEFEVGFTKTLKDFSSN